MAGVIGRFDAGPFCAFPSFAADGFAPGRMAGLAPIFPPCGFEALRDAGALRFGAAFFTDADFVAAGRLLFFRAAGFLPACFIPWQPWDGDVFGPPSPTLGGGVNS